MATPYGAFDRYGIPVQSQDNPAFTGVPPATPVLRDMPTLPPDRLSSPDAMPQLPSVQPQRGGLLKRAADFVMPPAGAATLDQPAAAGAPAAAQQPTGWFRERGATNTGLLSQTIPGKPKGYDPALGYDPAINIGDQIAQQGAKDKWRAQQAAASGQPAPAPLGSMPPINDQLRGFGSDVAQGAKDFAIGTGKMAGAASDVFWNMPAAGVRGLFGGDATNARQSSLMGVPTVGTPLPRSASGGIGKPRSYIGEGSQYEPAPAQSQTPPDIAPRTARESGPMDFPANVVPHYRMGDNGALTLTMPGGGTAEFAPGAGSRDLRARVGELAGQRLGGGQFETNAQVAARRPDLYGANGKPLLADAFGNAVNQPLADAAAAVDARNAERQRTAMTRGLLARADEMTSSAASARGAGTAASRRDAAGRLYALAQQSQQDIQQNDTVRRGQDLQLAARDRRAPIPVSTADGGSVLYDPSSGQWLQPPGAQGSGISKQDHERLKGITGHIGKAMGMDSAANPIDAATGAAYTAASRIGGGAYMATRGVRQFAGYTDADFAGIGQDVAAGRAAIRTGKDGMAYAIYHGEDGKAYGVPIGPAENYANIQPAAGQPAAAR